MTKFDASAVWKRFADPTKPQLSLFMAVPTVYGFLSLFFPTHWCNAVFSYAIPPPPHDGQSSQAHRVLRPDVARPEASGQRCMSPLPSYGLRLCCSPWYLMSPWEKRWEDKLICDVG